MTFADYQARAQTTASYAHVGNNYIYPTLGLVNEAGEVAGKIKKIERDDQNVITDERRTALKKELGDVLWYLAQLSTELGFDLEDIAAENLAKLQDRATRNTLHGDGDNR